MAKQSLRYYFVHRHSGTKHSRSHQRHIDHAHQTLNAAVFTIRAMEHRKNDICLDFLTGFIANEATKEVYGRPVGVTVLPTGALLVADDAANVIWHVAAK